MEISVHPKTNRPTEAWAELRPYATVMRFKTKHPKDPAPENKVRVVCISDTHSMTSHIKKSIPNGDILIHAGDFTKCGHISEVRKFNDWLGSLPHKHKVVIAGNHELTFDNSFHIKEGIDMTNEHRTPHTGDRIPMCAPGGEEIKSDCVVSNKLKVNPELGLKREVLEEAIENVSSSSDIQRELTNANYLQDSFVQLFGLKIYGSPWQPAFCGWAFNLPRGKALLNKWDLIPDDTDILVTHTPPLGYGDLCATGIRAGCVELLSTVQKRIKPKYHVYGHIHEGYGVRSDGRTVFINASVCDLSYMPNNSPLVFDIPIPNGFSRV